MPRTQTTLRFLDVDVFQRPEQNETSLSIVPRNHPVLTLQNLEAEASGLLDRLLTVFQENSKCAFLPLLRDGVVLTEPVMPSLSMLH